MMIPIGREDGHVLAMGHRVALEVGGVPELKRRCLETLSRLNDPPDSVTFQRLWLQPTGGAHESGEHLAVQSAPPPATAQAQGRRRR